MQGSELILQTAYRAWEVGLNFVPATEKKHPVGEWEEFKHKKITESEFKLRLNGHNCAGIICGSVSGNLEVIDVDQKNCPHGTLANDYFKLIHDNEPDLFNSLFIVRTPTGGYHLYYRCEIIEGNQKLAKRPTTPEEREVKNERAKVLIETRGEGGFIMAPPSPKYEPWQKNDIPTISPAKRKFLLDAARSFNELYEVQKAPAKPFTQESPYELTPWEDFDQRGDIITILENNHWKIDKKNKPRIYLTRPGKDSGTSADYHEEKKLFKSWSTSVSEFEDSKAYSHTAVYAILEHNGDFSKACSELEKQGYGKRKTVIQKSENPSEQKDPTQTDEDIFKHVYFPSWDNKPIERPAVISLGGIGLLTHQNAAALIANPGGGKSSIAEAVAANYINPACDSLGFTVDPECRTILIIDNERTDADVWNSYYRINKRAGTDRTSNMRGITLAGLRAVARVEHRKDIIKKLLDQHKPGLLLIDGAGDLVYDTNDLEQAIECRVWIREITAQYDLSVFVTLHPNPGSNKPRGHHGSEICRESESVLLSKPYDADVRILTTDFEHGKNRNNPKLSTAFRWSDEHKMFVSADLEEVQQGKLDRKAQQKEGKLIELAKAVLPPPNSMRPTELENILIEKFELSESTAKRKIKDMRDLGLIIKSDDGWYRMVV